MKCTLDCVPNITYTPATFHTIELLRWERSGKYSYLFCRCLPINARQYLIQSDRRIGRSKRELETLEELQIQYFQAFAKPERETLSHNRLLEALTSKASCIAFCFLVFSRFFIAAIRSIETQILPQF